MPDLFNWLADLILDRVERWYFDCSASASTAPIWIVCSALDPFVETRVRPIVRAFSQTVFDGVVVNVVHVHVQVFIVSDQVFPKASLPNTALIVTPA